MSMSEGHITAEQLRELVNYDPDTGKFTWRIKRRRVKPGSPVGGIGHRGYVKIKILQRQYLAHRLAWLYVTGEITENDIDHINGDTSDNRIANLRSVSRRENQRNMALFRTNKTGCPGVRFYPESGRWTAEIGGVNCRMHLGSFKSFEEARSARKAAEAKLGYHSNHGRAA